MLRRFTLSLLCACFLCPTASAQVASGAITGVVRDQAGASVSGATVTLDNRKWPEHGAIVKISWQRDVFERKQATMPAAASEGVGLQLTDADGGIH